MLRTYGEFISQFPWEWYCTLTFRRETSHRMAYKLFNKWKIQLKKASGQHINYVLVIEPTPMNNGAPHLHVLLHGVGQEKPYIWRRRWFMIGGWAKIRLYDPDLGASYYLGQKMDCYDVDVVFSNELHTLASTELTHSKEDPIHHS